MLAGLMATGACSESTDQSCIVGSLDCSCTAGGGCDPGLSCLERTCVVVDMGSQSASASASASGSSSATASASATATASETATSTTDTSAPSTTDDDSTDGGLILDVGSRDTDIGPSSGCRAIDVLFALDSSGSMIEERAALAATNAFSQILVTLEGLNGGGIDYRIGLTTANDHGFLTPLGWLEPDPWFDSEDVELETMSLAFNGAVGQIGNLGDPPVGCEHVLTSAVNLLASDSSGFVRDDALLVLVLLTDVDDFGDYDQAGGNDCNFGCGTQPSDLNALRTLLVDSVKSGQEDGVAAIVLAGDPSSMDGLNLCGQPGSCGCDGVDCAAFHADRLYEFAGMLGEQGIAADLCGANVPMVVETVLTDSIDQLCQDFQPEG